ncbi:TIGR01777 family oxidoreductase [Candidatus Methylocalor cossyra]|uniref:Epimerase family protein YfcH n=1 Tax=Candidatus Methylocalor cossyra TaxID=3108543 RepID=A0ABM9NE13_9GAMM
MEILVTGGTGFIGAALCQALQKAGHRLTVFTRDPRKVIARWGDRVTPLSDFAEWEPQRRFDAVINLAGESIIDKRWSERRKQVLWDSRVTFTRRLVEAIERAEAKPAVLISGSAVGVYGHQADTVLDEGSPGHNGFGQRLCAAWEQEARQAESLGVRVCILRTGLVIGKHGGFLARMRLPFKLGLGARIGDGRQWMSWIHLVDHIAVTRFLLESPPLHGVFNATAPAPVTNADFTACLAKLMGRPAWLSFPAWLLRLGAGERAELLLGSQRVLPIRLLAEKFVFSFETLEPALREALDIS